jgi:hypothetical protein
MKCWFCEQGARGVGAACGRCLCYQHANIHDEMTIAKSDTSTGYAQATITFPEPSNAPTVDRNGNPLSRGLEEQRARGDSGRGEAPTTVAASRLRSTSIDK